MLPVNAHQRMKLLQDFLSSCTLPKLPDTAVESLNAAITADEVDEVLKLLLLGKSPGPDWFTFLYYQTFSGQLLPYLTSVYNAFPGGEPIPQSILHS